MIIKIDINITITKKAINLHAQDRSASIAAPEAVIATKNVTIIPITCIIRKKILFFIFSSKNYLHAAAKFIKFTVKNLSCDLSFYLHAVVPTQNPGLFVITLTAHAEATLAAGI